MGWGRRYSTKRTFTKGLCAAGRGKGFYDVLVCGAYRTNGHRTKHSPVHRPVYTRSKCTDNRMEGTAGMCASYNSAVDGGERYELTTLRCTVSYFLDNQDGSSLQPEQRVMTSRKNRHTSKLICREGRKRRTRRLK